MKSQVIALLLLLFLAGCQKPISPLGVATDFYPPTEELHRGIVNKYYVHFRSADGYERSTDIRYYLYKINKEGKLETTIYNPAFEPIIRTITRFENGREMVEEQEQFWQRDSFPSQITENVVTDWITDTALLVTSTTFTEEIEEELTIRQLSHYDSLAEGRILKVFEKERNRTYHYPDTEDRTYESRLVNTYAQELGLFSREIAFEDGTMKMTLVEQFSAVELRKRQAATPKRVAYIDPAQVMDKGIDFAPCGDYIYDYYNGDPDGGPRGGKRDLWRYFGEHLDKGLLGNESGYLTFRFVINCEGEAGRFITEEAGLDFARKRFPEQLIEHVFQLLITYDDWQATQGREEALDAYAYVTLKLRDGELIDILP